ncbi:MAG: nuclear transport factor 2 family protein [Candidatus Bathyarchaeia archaeon]
MSVEDVKAAVRGVHDAIMSNDVERFISFFAEDATLTDAAGILKGPDGLRLWMKWLYSNFSRMILKDKRLIAEGDSAAHEYLLEGATPEGSTVSFSGVAIYEFKDGKIQHIRNFYDVLGIAGQVAKGWMARRAVNSIEEQFKRGLR